MKPCCISTLLLLTCLLALTGCGSSDGVLCGDHVERGIVVAVYDAQTHAPIAKDAVGTIEDGSYMETLTPAGGDSQGNLISIGGAFERPGTYTVRIEKSGYQTWEKKNVRVTKGVCNVNTVTLEADLQPAK